MTIFVSLPIYNEEDNIEPLINEIKVSLKSYDWEIIAVNDGSADNSLSILQEMRDKKKFPIIIVNHKENKGLGKALESIFKKAHEIMEEGDFLVIIDSDLTHRPVQILDMLEKDADVIIASRYVDNAKIKGVPFFRKILSLSVRYLVKVLFRLPVQDVSCGYRLYKYKIVKMFYDKYFPELIISNGFDSSLEILLKLNTLGVVKFCEIPIDLDYSERRGNSKINIKKTIKQYLSQFRRAKSY